MDRLITFAQAIREATDQAMELHDRILVMGQMVDSPPGIFGTTQGLASKYGAKRVMDFPIAENLMTFCGMGLAISGYRPLLVHQRLDFMIYSLDAIVNWMSLWRFKSNGNLSVPVTIRAIVGKGWGQGPQHSKSLHGWFAHVPGLRVAMPATACDAKGLLMESLFGENPTLFIEGRSLFDMKDSVPEQPYRIGFGKAAVRKEGTDVTLIAFGNMVPLALRCASARELDSISVEVIDGRTVRPLDRDTFCRSTLKTGRLCVMDPAWPHSGIASEVIAGIAKSGIALKSAPIAITYPDSHTPVSHWLEQEYYPDDELVTRSIRMLMSH